LGYVLRDQKKPAEASEWCRKAIAINPRYAPAHWCLGNALCDLKRLDDALVAYRKAADLDPNLGPPHYPLRETSRRLARWHEAAAVFGRSLEVHEPARQALAPDANPNQVAYYAPQLLLANDPGAYRRLCARVIGKLGDTEEPRTAYLVARICALGPDMVP